MNFSTSLLNLFFVFLAYILSFRKCCVGTSYNDKIIYSYAYAIETKNVITQHWEERIGDVVRGEYSLLDPDGRVRVVDYQVEGNKGFRAVVTFRPPGGKQLMGHLSHPGRHQSPIKLTNPVETISPDLLYGRKIVNRLNGY